MFFHYASRRISAIFKISTFFEDLSSLNPRSHLNSTRVVKSLFKSFSSFTQGAGKAAIPLSKPF